PRTEQSPESSDSSGSGRAQASSGAGEKKDPKPQTKTIEKINNFITQLQGVPLSQKLFFTKNLGVMTKAGLSLSAAVKTLSLQTNNKLLKKILQKTHEEIEQGNYLSDSLAKYPKTFSPVFINMIRAGEKGGNLEKVLKELALQMKKTHELSSKIKSALAYPAFILVAMAGIGILMMIFVVPQVIDIFSDMEATLPLPTRILIFTSSFVTSNGLLLAILFLISVAAFVKFIRTKTGRRYFHIILLKSPVIGSIIKKINLAKFSRTFSSLLATDIPIVQTLEITGTVLGNTIYRDYVTAASEKVKKGESVAKILSENDKLFPPVVIQMIQVGEETGTLDNILQDLADFYEDEVSNLMEGLASIIEPVLIIILGIAVAGMALSIIMPMYSLTEQF
ncbi:type II secretion system F family protein, partial [Candidatus Falkowbacteria bacterium]|nr:type II secretion system F family protein [Candidatus Falkowbacteria bacterium]